MMVWVCAWSFLSLVSPANKLFRTPVSLLETWLQRLPEWSRSLSCIIVETEMTFQPKLKDSLTRTRQWGGCFVSSPIGNQNGKSTIRDLRRKTLESHRPKLFPVPYIGKA